MHKVLIMNIAYSFNPETRVYTGTIPIQESPLEPGVWLLPANVTTTPPPDVGVGQVPAWIDGQWVSIPNPLPQSPPIEDRRSLMIVTRFQALAALLEAGKLSQAEAYFADPETPAIQRLAWQNSLHFYRVSPLVQAVGQLLGLDDEELDSLFETASGIQI